MPDQPVPPVPPQAPGAPPKTPVFRWKNLRKAFAVTGLILLFTLFLVDPLVKWGIEKAGTAANGAKVELDGVNVSLLHLGVTLTRLQITDANDPMTNALEVARMRLKLAPKPLFWRKVVIEDASIDGIRTGTPRRSSGAVGRAKKEEPSGPGAADKAKQTGLAAVASLKDKFDPRNIKPEDLASYKKIKEEQVHWEAASQSWQSKLDAVQVDDREKEAKAFMDRVKKTDFSGVQGLKNAQGLLKDGRKLKDDLETTRRGFDAVKKDLSDEVGRAKGSLKDIEALKQKDVDGSLGGLKDAFSTEGIVRGLIGPAWTAKVQTGLGWFHKIRGMIPQKKKGEKAPPPPPRQGRNITFPFKYRWPEFLLEKASLSGETQGGLSYTGTLKDVASDPKLWGRPITLAAGGGKGGESLSLRAELDYTRDVAREQVRLSYAGFPLDGVKLGDAAGPVTLAKGAGRAAADLEARGEEITGHVDFSAAPVALQHAPDPAQAGNRLTGALHDVLTGVRKLDVSFLVSGRISSPDVHIRSSLDAQVAGAVKAAMQKQLGDLRAQAQARVNALVGDDQKKLSDLVDSRAGAAAQKAGLKDKQIKSVQDQIQKALDGLVRKEALPGGGNGKPDLKKLFKRK